MAHTRRQKNFGTPRTRNAVQQGGQGQGREWSERNCNGVGSFDQCWQNLSERSAVTHEGESTVSSCYSAPPRCAPRQTAAHGQVHQRPPITCDCSGVGLQSSQPHPLPETMEQTVVCGRRCATPVRFGPAQGEGGRGQCPSPSTLLHVGLRTKTKEKISKASGVWEAEARRLEARSKPWAPQFDGDRPGTGQDTGDRSIRFRSPQLCWARSGVSGCVGPPWRKACVQRARQRLFRSAIGRVILPSIVPGDGAAVPQNRRGCHARESAGAARRTT